jgi:(p)ppGpp synthase/HD superfamily hydrolase
MHRELVYLKGLAKGSGFMQTLKAINVASQLHDGQKRKLGEDYIEHPMRVAKELVSLKLYDDKLLAYKIILCCFII